MSSSIADAMRQIVHHKGISEDLIIEAIKDILLAAYKKKYGTNENVIAKIDEEKGEVSLYARKKIVEEVKDNLRELGVKEARKINKDCDINDEVLIEINPEDMGRVAAQLARQMVESRLREIEKNVIYSEYIQKVGELIVGQFQRVRNGNVFLDLGRVEGVLPRNQQSPREEFETGEQVKAMIIEVDKTDHEARVILSRKSPLFVKKLFELEIPEISNRTIEVKSIVRYVGYRTKMAVYSVEVDPVGSCVGMKGIRIQGIVKELEGEKIDIIRYHENIREYIGNALSPAKVNRVIILNEKNKESLAVVEESELSLAIGKQGQNVKLARKLTGWNIDIKTVGDFEKLGYEDEMKRLADDIFKTDEKEGVGVVEHDLEELEGLGVGVMEVLRREGINTLEELIEKGREDLMRIEGLGEEEVQRILDKIEESVVIVEEGEEEVEVEEEEYQYLCPECDTEIREGVESCPSCGIKLEFE